MLSIKKIIGTGVALLLPLAAYADAIAPELAKAKKNYNEETLCVKPVEDMRKNHMHYILHQRDETMRDGIRTEQFSLDECIECHNAPGSDGKVASSKSDKHFCSTCHTFAAVKIDCFTCHADKPQNTQYRHSLSGKMTPGHSQFAAEGLNEETLQLLTTKEERQQ